MHLVTAYRQCTNQADLYITQNVAHIPKGFVHACLKQFAIAFATATALSKQNRLVTGLKSGSFNLLATIINFVALKKIKSYCEENSIPFNTQMVSFVLREAILCLLNRENPSDHAKNAALSFMIQQGTSRIGM